MIKRHSSGLPRPPVLVNDILHNGTRPTLSVILLTGTTGSLNSFILVQLVENMTVENMYAFNRPSSTPSVE